MKKKRFQNILQIPFVSVQIKPNALFRKYMNERRKERMGRTMRAHKRKEKQKGSKGDDIHCRQIEI